MDAVIRQCLVELFELGIPKYVSRDIEVPLLKDMVTIVVGGRKVGKTYLTYQLIDTLLHQQKISSLRQVCYLHFDDERLLELQTDDLRRIDALFLELTDASPQTPLVFVFDEIHRVKNWEYFVLRLNRNPNWHVVVTGSSADLEEDNVGRQLRGKSFTVKLHPLSFEEFLRFKGESFRPTRHSVADEARLSRLFEQYMQMGSYPAMPGIAAVEQREVLRQYFNSVVASDFVDRRKINHPLSCKIYLRNLLQKNSAAYTHKKERNTLSSIGHKVPANVIADWFNWAETAYLIGVNAVDSPSIKKQEQNYRKIYAIDWAMANAVSSFGEPRTSRTLESIVYWHLKRRGLRTSYTLLGPHKNEIDFVVARPEAPPHLAIQVCLDLADPDVLQRETAAFAFLTTQRYAAARPLILTLHAPPSSVRTEYPLHNVWKWILDPGEVESSI